MNKKLLIIPALALSLAFGSCNQKANNTGTTTNVTPTTNTDVNPTTGTTDPVTTATTPDTTTGVTPTTNTEPVPTTTTHKEVLTNVYLAGDSTVKTYEDDQYIGGWGQYIDLFFDEEVNVINCAEGGRSSRSFINEGRLYKIEDNAFNYSFTYNNGKAIGETIKEGDYMFIQFAHNDDDSKKSSSYSTLYDRMVPLGEKDSNGIYPVTAPEAKKPTTYLPSEYTSNVTATDIQNAYSTIAKYGSEYYSYDCGGTYKWYLKQYIDLAKSKKATPVLVTPVVRVAFNGNTIKSGAGYHGIDFAYVEAVRQLASEENVELIDLFASTKELAEKANPTYASYLMALKPNALTGEWPSGYDKTYNNAALGCTGIEGTHYNKYGAYLTAAYAARYIKNNSKLDISKYVLDKPEAYVDPSNLLPKAKINELEALLADMNVTNPNRVFKDPNKVIEQIEALPEVEEIDDDNYLTYDPIVNSIYDEYYELNIDDRAKVTNYDHLVEVRAEIDGYIRSNRPVPTSTTVYNALSFTEETLTEAKTINNITAGKDVQIKTYASSFKYNDVTYSATKSFYLSGAGNNTSKYVEFTTTKSATITIGSSSSSSSATRYLSLINKADSSKSYTFEARGAVTSISIEDIPAGTYYLVSTSGGIYVHGIIVEYFD